MNTRLYTEVIVTLLVIMDPIGSVPIFLAVTRKLGPAARHRAAALAAATALGVISLFAFLGEQILDYLHVTIAALQGAGGLLLLLVALQLLTGNTPEADEADPHAHMSVAMVPLGTPLLAGPGAIVAIIVFVGGADGWTDRFSIGLGVVTVLTTVLLCLWFSGVLIRVLRPTGILLVTRIAGILLAAIAVQMVADSVIAFSHQA